MRILVGVDGSRPAFEAARMASEWLGRQGSTVELLTVIPPRARSSRRRPVPPPPAAANWRAAARQWQETAAAPFRARGDKVIPVVRVGDPAQVLLARAAEKGADLVVVGARGGGETPFLEIGSVARTVLDRAPVPVLMVRTGRDPAEGRRTASHLHPFRILVGIDPSTSSEHLLRWMGHSLEPGRSRLLVRTVVEEEAEGRAGHDARALARGAAARLRDGGFEASAEILEGPVVPTLLEEARGADLLILGGRGIGEDGEVDPGSVSVRVARSTPCPVLLLREPAPGPAAGEALGVAAETGAAVAEPPPDRSARALVPDLAVSWRNLEPEPGAEALILRGFDRIRRVVPDLLQCTVAIDRPNAGQRNGNPHRVRIDLTIPGRSLTVTRPPPAVPDPEPLPLAIGRAFDRARRVAVEEARSRRGEVKRHDIPPHGVVEELAPDHGFVRTPGGRRVYFHRNSVLEGGWEGLEVGSEVRFSEEAGAEGPQASTVHVLGKHHLASTDDALAIS